MELWKRYNDFIKRYLQDETQDQESLSYSLDIETNKAINCYTAFIFGLDLAISDYNETVKDKLKDIVIDDYIQTETIEDFLLTRTEEEIQKEKYTEIIKELKTNLIKALNEIDDINLENGIGIEKYNHLIYSFKELFSFYFFALNIQKMQTRIEENNKKIIPVINNYKRTKYQIEIRDRFSKEIINNPIKLQEKIGFNIGKSKAKPINEYHTLNSKKLQYHQELKEKNIIKEIPKELLYLHITNEDMKLYQALASIVKRISDDKNAEERIEGKFIIPLTSVWQLYTGNDNAKMTDKNKQFLYDSLEKFADYSDEIDRSEVIEKWNKNKLNDIEHILVKQTNKMLYWEKAQAIIKGKLTECIEVITMPLLYENAYYKSQISTINKDLIEIKDINKTKSSIKITKYLQARIIQMKDEKQKKRILFETLYKELNINGKIQRQRARNTIIKILDQYIKNGFIKSYSIEKEHNSYRAILIKL